MEHQYDKYRQRDQRHAGHHERATRQCRDLRAGDNQSVWRDHQLQCHADSDRRPGSFRLGSIPSPRFVNAPFGVTLIRAVDSINQVFTNFAGAVALTASNGITVNPTTSGGFTQGVHGPVVTIS